MRGSFGVAAAVALALTVFVAGLLGPVDTTRHASAAHARLQVAAAPASPSVAPSADARPVLRGAGPDARPSRLPAFDTPALGEPPSHDVHAAAAPSLEKQLAKLNKKLAKAQAKQDLFEAKGADAQAAGDAAQAGLDAAQTLPDATPAEQKAKAKAIAKWTKKLAKANKKAAKFAGKLLAWQQKQEALQDELEALDALIAAQTADLLASGGAGAVSFSWADVADAEGYVLWWSLSAGVDPQSATRVDDVSSPFVVDELAGGTSVFAVVAPLFDDGEGLLSSEAAAVAGAGPYDPDWADVDPLRVITLEHDGGLSDAGNGARLVDAIDELLPGDRLVVGAGTWSLEPKTYLSPQGTSDAPVWIVAAAGERPVLTRPNADQNVLNVGPPGSPPATYACLRGFEITGGSAGLRVGSASELWIDDNHIHHVGEAGLTANQLDTARLFITRNEISHTDGYGEGMYLGANNGAVVMSDSVIALNHVHDTTGADQGDGIEVKQGSFGNWIVGNAIHDTKYPCLLVYGTDGEAPNVIERNVLVGSQDNTLQVQGEALVRNNLVVGGVTAFASHDHQGSTRDLEVVHNTFVNVGKAVKLSHWNGREGMLFANNAVVSETGTAVDFGSGASGVTVVGNVASGALVAVSGGFVSGNGLADFVDLDGGGEGLDATPSAGSALLGAGSASQAVDEDLHGDARDGSLDAGCVDG